MTTADLLRIAQFIEWWEWAVIAGLLLLLIVAAAIKCRADDYEKSRNEGH